MMAVLPTSQPRGAYSMAIRPGICFSLVALAACASGGSRPPETVTRVGITGPAGDYGISEIRNSPGSATMTLPAPSGAVWAVLPDVYEELGVPDAGAGTEELVFGSLDFLARRIEGKRLSTFIDCGMGVTAMPRADEYRVNMTIITKLTPVSDGTLTETLVQATARPRDVSGNPVSCQSNGTLETRITELIALNLGRRAR